MSAIPKVLVSTSTQVLATIYYIGMCIDCTQGILDYFPLLPIAKLVFMAFFLTWNLKHGRTARLRHFLIKQGIYQQLLEKHGPQHKAQLRLRAYERSFSETKHIKLDCQTGCQT